MKIRGGLLLGCSAGAGDALKRGNAPAKVTAPRVHAACGMIEAEANAFLTKSRLVGRHVASEVATLVRSDFFIAVAPVITLVVLLRVCRRKQGKVRNAAERDHSNSEFQNWNDN
jgi:hypothetical protein